jgi:pilus assembly protein Flp/PilA
MLMMMYTYLLGLVDNEEGQGLVEYALIIALVVIVVIGAITLLGPAISNIFNNIVNQL